MARGTHRARSYASAIKYSVLLRMMGVQKGQNVKNIKSKIKIKAISLVMSLLMLMPSVTGIVSATTEAKTLA